MLEESEAYLDELRRASKRRSVLSYGILGLVVLCALGALGLASNWETVVSIQNGERDMLGDRVYEAQHAAKTHELDLEAIHTTLLPAWAIELAHLEDRWTNEERAYNALYEAVKADENLAEIVEEFREIGWAPNAHVHTRRLEYLAWAWSDYLKQNGHPYAIDAGVMALSSGDFLFFKTYVVQRRPTATIDGELYEMELVKRLDKTNVRELYLGATHVEGVQSRLVADRIDEFNKEYVLELFSEGAHLTPLQQRVRRELSDRLSAADIKTLKAELSRHTLVEEIEHEIRRHPDCIGFQLHDDTIRHFELLRNMVFTLDTDGTNHPCTLTGAQNLRLKDAGYWRRANEAEFEAAYRTLLHELVRTVAVHEARHLADVDEGIDCSDCRSMTDGVMVESSAYVASFAWSPSPALAVYQACQVRGTAGAHGESVRQLLAKLGANCNEIPDDFAVRARKLEADLFGREAQIQVELD